MKAPSRDIKNLYKRQTVLQFMVFTLITVFIWVGFSLFRSQKKTAITPEQLQLAAPLTPNIDTKVLDELQAKTSFDQAQLEAFPIYQIQVEDANQKKTTPSPSPTPSSEIESSIPIDLGAIISQPQPEASSSTASASNNE